MGRKVLNMNDESDMIVLHRSRRIMLTRARKTVVDAFEELRSNYRIGLRSIRRIVGPGIITSTGGVINGTPISRINKPGRRSDFRHDVALGIIHMRNALATGRIGHWTLRKDGTRMRINVEDVPDLHFNSPTDWAHVMEFVFAQGWSYNAFAKLVGSHPSQISHLARGLQSPRLPFGECVLWAARQIRDDNVIRRAQSAHSFRRPTPPSPSKGERTKPWWLDRIYEGGTSTDE